ncbi:hypothetical protein MIND_00181400 [Mycena indigotica]|uniref:Zinc finger double-stranded RNA binding domain-containing protein n=1 Tax=Mycena indigotica TaxID=2126181 RepID=A0A8H6T6C8_9AGAR|nr:uncharacterized protein MIND_00181400 [Mycena indigotica]KAF7311715.1 hypothetical protein MIND_00181400 [Mycena indigotica]
MAASWRNTWTTHISTALRGERVFKNEQGLHEHCRQSSGHHYCTPCRRLFTSANNLNAHMNSGAAQATHDHAPRPRPRAVLHQRPAAAAHLEAGSCAPGANRQSPTATSAAGHAQRDHRPPGA